MGVFPCVYPDHTQLVRGDELLPETQPSARSMLGRVPEVRTLYTTVGPGSGAEGGSMFYIQPV
jgi:hypothetical protein